VSAVRRYRGLQQLPGLNGRTYMMLAGRSSEWPPVVPFRKTIMPESESLGKLLDAPLLFVRSCLFECGNLVGADLMNDTA
jgi:hypothetical protein